MKNFNLVQIVPSLESGGVEQGTIDLANYLASINIKNYTISNGGKMLSYLNKKNVKNFILPVNSKNFLKMPFLGKKINLIIKENNINIIHIRSRAPAWIIPYLKKENIKLVSTFHNVYESKNFLKKMYNKGLSKTDKIVAISKYVSEEISNTYNIDPSRISTINRGIDVDFYDAKIENQKNLNEFINKYNIPSNKKIILFPGRLTEWKGQIEFLNIIERFTNDPYIFYFVGDVKNTSYAKKLTKLILQKKLFNCKILGHLNPDDLKMMYTCSDLIISAPLRPEGFGRVVSESLSMKKIIIGYNYGGVKDQFDGLDSIYKIEPLNHENIIKKIIEILSMSEENLINLKNFGREHVVLKFSKKKMLESYLTLYRNI